jgi:hypothetical protein
LGTILTTKSYLTGNQSITISGDASGSGTTSIALTLANTGVIAGTYNSVTVNSKGLVTVGSTSQSITNVTTVTSNYSITTANNVILANGTLTATLPATNTVPTGTIFQLKTISVNGVLTIAGSGSNTIDGSSTITLNQQYQSITVVSNGTNWFII